MTTTMTLLASDRYDVRLTVEGTTDLLFARWDLDFWQRRGCGPVDPLTWAYWSPHGTMEIPGALLKASLRRAGAFFRDPRSKHKSAYGLLYQAIGAVTSVDLGVRRPDYIRKWRCGGKGYTCTRERPAMRAGWRGTFGFVVNDADLVPVEFLRGIVGWAGTHVGMGFFHPEFGAFRITHLQTLALPAIRP